MHILVVNDDGPPSNNSSPYVHSLISTLQEAGHTISVVLPHTQRSWIGKAHMVGQTLTQTYFRPGTILQDDGVTQQEPFNDNGEEWILVDGTPASCVQVGLYHAFKDRGPIDLVLSGPNYGRNTTALFALSSGTLGGALEGAVNGKKSIALSYAFTSREHNPNILAAASLLSRKLIEKLYKEWPEDVHVYSINVPLEEGVENTKILYAQMLQNTWTKGSSYEELPADAEDVDPEKEEQKHRESGQDTTVKNAKNGRRHCTYRWAPNFADVKEGTEKAGHGDGWVVMQSQVSVTPLRANFWHLPHYDGEIKLDRHPETAMDRKTNRSLHALIDYPDEYVQPLIVRALKDSIDLQVTFINSLTDLSSPTTPVIQFATYEALDLKHAMVNRTTSLVSAYVIRKALIRKHYLSNTISNWLVKHPNSILTNHFKPCAHFELDFAEFLDDALVDAWDLNEAMSRNDERSEEESKEWWILKPGMSDGGNCIRLFSNLSELQTIFEEWEEEEVDEDDTQKAPDTDAGMETNSSLLDGAENTMTSQLRHFIAQPYIDPPLLLEAYGRRKFHIRTYVLAVGSLKVYVSREMLVLFAAKPYQAPGISSNDEIIDLAQHLTNTCFQNEETRASSVFRFWDLKQEGLPDNWKEKIFTQICEITGEVFEAAAREQMVHFQTLPNAFEIFGVDFLVDHASNVWLLELNAYPDFKQTGIELQEIIVGSLFREVVRTAIIPFFDSVGVHEGSPQMRMVRSINLGRR